MERASVKITGKVSGIEQISGSLNIDGHTSAEPYTDAYEFTPTQETQTIDIGGKRALADIVINPIPNNYGLITWDGATLTVS